MKNIAYIILIILFGSCNKNKEQKDQDLKVDEHFDLNEDLINFTEFLLEGDTLELFVNLSLCMSSGYEKSFIINKGKYFSISTIAKGPHTNDKLLELDAIYEKDNDSLNFKQFFEYLENNKNYNEDLSPRFIVIYKEDSLKYYSEGMNDLEKKIGYYSNIINNLYPDAPFLEPPPPPL